MLEKEEEADAISVVGLPRSHIKHILKMLAKLNQAMRVFCVFFPPSEVHLSSSLSA